MQRPTSAECGFAARIRSRQSRQRGGIFIAFSSTHFITMVIWAIGSVHVLQLQTKTDE